QVFSFTLTGGPDGLSDAFTLTDASAPRASASIRPGTYAAAQSSVPAGWDLTSATCDDRSPIGAIHLDPGETVHCVFPATRRRPITADVPSTPRCRPQVFSFTLTGGPDAINQGFGLADATAPHGSGAVRPGTYAIAQSSAGAMWDLS